MNSKINLETYKAIIYKNKDITTEDLIYLLRSWFKPRQITISDTEISSKIIKGLEKKKNHCPCQIEESYDTLCPCKTMIEKNECHCMLWQEGVLSEINSLVNTYFSDEKNKLEMDYNMGLIDSQTYLEESGKAVYLPIEKDYLPILKEIFGEENVTICRIHETLVQFMITVGMVTEEKKKLIEEMEKKYPHNKEYYRILDWKIPKEQMEDWVRESLK